MLIGSCSDRGRPFVGEYSNAGVADLGAIDSALPTDVGALLESPDGLSRAAGAAQQATVRVPVETIDFRPPVPAPPAIWCAALTFDSHIGEAAGRKAPAYPLFFLRTAASQTGHRQPLIRPAVSRMLDYEGELAAVIGRTAHHVPVEEALGYVAGYSAYNEGSVRDWQKHTVEITPGKNFARTASFGPWLATADAFGDPYQHTITTTVNGEVRQHESVAAIRFRIEYLIHYLSQIQPLTPGTVIACGTPGGVGMRRTPPVFLCPGDTVTVAIDGIGTLENEILDEPADAVNWQPTDGEIP